MAKVNKQNGVKPVPPTSVVERSGPPSQPSARPSDVPPAQYNVREFATRNEFEDGLNDVENGRLHSWQLFPGNRWIAVFEV